LGTAAFDLLFALIAGFAIMPAVFAAGIEPGAGPGLIFETLPYIFAKMGAAAPWLSRTVSILFFLTIVIAALTSSISMCEVGVAYLVEERGQSRRKASLLVFAGTWLLGALCSLSFGPLSGVHLFGRTIFDFCDHLTSDYLMTFGSLLFVLFVGWKMKRETVWNEFTGGGSLRSNVRLFGVVWFLIRYVAPLVILTIFVTNLVS
jgi:NSS family neurotransmitter:Na+ symporter